jgi:rubrerythrin
MNLDRAIEIALEYEGGVHRTYLEAMRKTSDPSAQRIFKVLCGEEKQHIAYLQERLDEWRKAGKIELKKLSTSIPDKETIARSLGDMKRTIAPGPSPKAGELKLLRQVLDAEIKATDFYREMVRTLDAEGREMFRRFVEIEQGHEAIVQAEIDSLSRLGFWFDIAEFRLEAE